MIAAKLMCDGRNVWITRCNNGNTRISLHTIFMDRNNTNHVYASLVKWMILSETNPHESMVPNF